MEIKGAVEQWESVRRALVGGGWDVQVRLMWVAEARRGHDYEQGLGLTRDEAFEQLKELTRLDEVVGVP